MKLPIVIMLRFHNYNIVFQEVPGEVTLALNVSNCPNRCKGCHSPYLQADRGEQLNERVLDTLLEKYGEAITCVCFMGGDADPQAIEMLARYIREWKGARLKTAWYSGKVELPEQFAVNSFNYIKLGPYIESLGGLESPNTNQRFYCIEHGKLTDQSSRFLRKQQLGGLLIGL